MPFPAFSSLEGLAGVNGPTPLTLYRAIRVWLLFALVGSLSPGARAQPCGAKAQKTNPFDWPQITSSAIVVPCASLQFENGFEETGYGGQRGFDFPETAVRFGVANEPELRFGVPDFFQNAGTSCRFRHRPGRPERRFQAAAWRSAAAGLTYP